MTQALAMLLGNSIDYAGTFPPAELSLAETVARYLRYVEGDDAWIVGRLCCGAADLAELATELKTLPVRDPIFVTVIGRSGPWDDARSADAEAMNAFLDAVGERADIAGYEVRVPDHTDLQGWLVDLRGFGGVDLFVELPWDPAMRESLARIAETESVFAKGRCGGDRVPSAEELGGFLAECLALDVPFKLTAGLHHAFPTDGQHGLVNVLAATALGYAEELTPREIADVLRSGATRIAFEEDGLRYEGMAADLETLEAVREDLFLSVGSCSVEEPLQELAALGLVKGERA